MNAFFDDPRLDRFIKSATRAAVAVLGPAFAGLLLRKLKPRSTRMTPELAGRVKWFLTQGVPQHEIAAKFGINQGRCSEIATGKRFADVKPRRP